MEVTVVKGYSRGQIMGQIYIFGFRFTAWNESLDTLSKHMWALHFPEFTYVYFCFLVFPLNSIFHKFFSIIQMKNKSLRLQCSLVAVLYIVLQNC